MKLPQGFLTSAIACGIKAAKTDLGLIYCKPGAVCSGFFTANANPSYSVLVSKEHIKSVTKALIVNSGNANCFSHRQGLSDTRALCASLARVLGVHQENVLVASTGIIGKRLPFAKIRKALPRLINALGAEWHDFAKSILTTDTSRKVSYRSVDCVSGRLIGFAKGAGMINPHMATMLAFILTDVSIDRKTLHEISRQAIEESFNAISVDGCMSTNDSVYIMSSRQTASLKCSRDKKEFADALRGVCRDLARMIIKDAEGATKFITLTIAGAATQKEAQCAAQTCANSMLVKTALYGANPNWGRFVAALGQVGIKVKEGKLAITSTALSAKEVAITIDLKRGRFSQTIYTSDLTPAYVNINAGYS